MYKVWFSFYNGISIFMGCLFVEELLWYYLTQSWEDNWVHAFPKDISPKVNVIIWQQAHFDSAVKDFSHYLKGLPHRIFVSYHSSTSKPYGVSS